MTPATALPGLDGEGRTLFLMAATMPHRCDETCVCPIHGTPMWYSPASDDHACQDANCVYAGGVRALYGVWMDVFRPFL